jgi:hypothetical protein
MLHSNDGYCPKRGSQIPKWNDAHHKLCGAPLFPLHGVESIAEVAEARDNIVFLIQTLVDEGGDDP